MSKKPTEKQQLARDRNYFKFKISGITIPKKSLTEHEKNLVDEIYLRIQALNTGFNDNSKLLGLKVNNRCWCNKIIKDDEKECCEAHKL